MVEMRRDATWTATTRSQFFHLVASPLQDYFSSTTADLHVLDDRMSMMAVQEILHIDE